MSVYLSLSLAGLLSLPAEFFPLDRTLTNVPATMINDGVSKRFFFECVDAIVGAIVRPEPLPRVRNVIPYPEEYEAAGTIIKEKAELENLPDGVYVYLLSAADDTEGEDTLIIHPRFSISEEALARLRLKPEALHLLDQITSESVSNRNLELEGQFRSLGIRYLATHRSLYRKLISKLRNSDAPQRVFVRTSGQFAIRNGQVIEISNEGSVFHGETNNLFFAAYRLWGKGLPLQEGTVLVDVFNNFPIRSRSSGAVQRRDAYYHILVRTDSALNAVYKELLELDRELATYVPHPWTKGLTDREHFMDFISGYIQEDADRDFVRKQQTLDEIGQLMERMDRDGPLLATVFYGQSHKKNRLGETIISIREFMREYRKTRESISRFSN